jgi:hypothetical protein
MEGGDAIENGGGSGKLCLRLYMILDLTRRSIAHRYRLLASCLRIGWSYIDNICSLLVLH